MTGTVPRPTSALSDVKVANLARMTRELQDAGLLSRAELARRAGLSVPTAHRLIADLVELGLAERKPAPEGDGRPGRPPVVYRFRDEIALLAAADIGNETTRFAVTTLSGRVLGRASMSSGRLGQPLARTLASRIRQLITEVAAPDAGLRAAARPRWPVGALAATGIGIAAVVDARGVLRAPPVHRSWAGIPLRASLTALLGCQVAVAQDDHLSPVAESSEHGTFPGAASLLVLEIGRGIGVGLTIHGVPVAGAGHRFGRIAGWPVSQTAAAGPLPGRTLGECLGARGLVRQYRAAGGSAVIRDGAGLAAAARAGDRRAGAVFEWAAHEVGEIVARLRLLCDPEAIVIGGGLSRAFDLLEQGVSAALPAGVPVACSVLGDQAVVTGAVLTARALGRDWLSEQLAPASSAPGNLA
jgi:glucokinase